jgi:Flp pilus assembly protein TadD
MGRALLKQGKKADAAKEFRAVLDVAPSHASAQSGLAAAK